MLNVRSVLHHLGSMLLGLATVLLAMAGFAGLAWWRGTEPERWLLVSFLISAAMALLAGAAAWLPTRARKSPLGNRDAIVLVVCTWIVAGVFSAAPMYLWHVLSGDTEHFPTFVDAFFEAMSGLTTTGATVLTGIDGLPRSLLLWRALMHWFGGLGIVVLFVAVLPPAGAGGRMLYQIESSALDPSGLRPRIRETARVVLWLYAGLTAAETLSLRITGMGWFDALCHTCGTLATGGFSTRDASIGAFDSVAIEVVVIVFMVLGAVNFGLYHQIMRGRWRRVLADRELRFFVIVLVVAVGVTAFTLVGRPITLMTGEHVTADTGTAIRYAAFNVVSINTTTGFCTADTDQWPFAAKMCLVAVCFMGGCAGSTAGGIKVVRIWIAIKSLAAEVERSFRRGVIRPVRVGPEAALDARGQLGGVTFVLSMLGAFIVVACALALIEGADGADWDTAFSASVATFCTTGPGFGRVGATQTYAWLSDAGKLLLCVQMIVGRMEIYAVLALLTPRFWSAD